jgi:hypothetical protein
LRREDCKFEASLDYRVPGQCELYSETLSQNKTTTTKKQLFLNTVIILLCETDMIRCPKGPKRGRKGRQREESQSQGEARLACGSWARRKEERSRGGGDLE